MDLSLFELEADPAGFGDPGGEPADYTAYEDPGAPPEPEPAPPEPQYMSRAEVEQMLAERDAQLAYQLGGDPYQGVDPYANPYAYQQPYAPAPPEFDPFDAESVRALMRQEIMAAQQPLAQMLTPLAEEHENQRAQRWADESFQRLGVPDDANFRAAVLAASKGYETDPWGRPVHPQIALQQAYQLMRPLVDAQRKEAAGQAEQQAAQQAEQRTAQLRAVAGAPSVPAGPGGLEGEPEPGNVRQAFRAAFERVTAGGAGNVA